MSVSPDQIVASMVSLPSKMQRNYLLLGELDKRFDDVKKQMEEQCAHALDDVLRAAANDKAHSDALVYEHSSRIASFRTECSNIAEEKITLAEETYKLVENHLQQLGADYRKYEQQLRRERDTTEARHLDYRLDDWELDGAECVKEHHNSIVDPNEPKYCYCNEVSYGEMVACDNPEVCVNLLPCPGVTRGLHAVNHGLRSCRTLGCLVCKSTDNAALVPFCGSVSWSGSTSIVLDSRKGRKVSGFVRNVRVLRGGDANDL